MNNISKVVIGTIIGILLGGYVVKYDITNPLGNKTLMLPEEICQASKGDHMQYYERNDTVFLEYTFAGHKMPIEIQGQQVVVGENIDYKQNNLIAVSPDTIKLLWNFAQREVQREKDSIDNIKKP